MKARRLGPNGDPRLKPGRWGRLEPGVATGTDAAMQRRPAHVRRDLGDLGPKPGPHAIRTLKKKGVLAEGVAWGPQAGSPRSQRHGSASRDPPAYRAAASGWDAAASAPRHEPFSSASPCGVGLVTLRRRFAGVIRRFRLFAGRFSFSRNAAVSASNAATPAIKASIRASSAVISASSSECESSVKSGGASHG